MTCIAALCIFLTTELRAADGDTFYRSAQGFRIWGIDTSERGAPDYNDHRALMTDILTHSTLLICEDMGYATTFRGSWKCEAEGGPYDDRDIGWIMCEAGFARDVPDFSLGYYEGCEEP